MRPRSAISPAKFRMSGPAPLASAIGSAMARRSDALIHGRDNTSRASECASSAAANCSSSRATSAAVPASRAAWNSALA